MTRRDSLILRSAAVWTVFIWGTRMRNLVADPSRSTGFKVVHLALAGISVAFAAAIWMVATRSRRSQRDSSRSGL